MTASADFAKRLDQTAEDTEALLGRRLSDTLLEDEIARPKRRILEIYLNIAELGPTGQFGAHAGAAYAFGRPALALGPREAALLAAILPNPHARSARNPGPGVRRLAVIYVGRAQAPGLQRCWPENRGL